MAEPTPDVTGDVIVVILGGGRGTRLEPLTLRRSKPAVPIAGKYRLIDIPISNALHSRMERIFVLTQFNSASLHRHIVNTYKFDIFSRGFVQILAAQQTPEGERWYQGTADAVRQNLPFLSEIRGEHVLILSGDHLYRMDYREMLRRHVESGADISLAAQPCSAQEIAGFGAVRVDEQGRVREFREKPRDADARRGMEADAALLERFGFGEGKPYLASMGIYIFNKSVLVDSLDNDLTDFGRDILPRAIDRWNVQAYLFGGYWRDIGTIEAFYQAHMDLLHPGPPFDFHDPDWPFYTRPRYLPGARLHDVSFTRSILAEGSILVDSTIEQSIVGIRSRLVRATVRRSLLMGNDPYPPPGPPGSPPVGIGEGTVIQDAIVDKNARIGAGVRIENREGLREAKGDGWAVRDGLVIVMRNAVIPDGTVI